MSKTVILLCMLSLVITGLFVVSLLIPDGEMSEKSKYYSDRIDNMKECSDRAWECYEQGKDPDLCSLEAKICQVAEKKP